MNRLILNQVTIVLLLVVVLLTGATTQADSKRVAMIAKLEQAVVLISTFQSGIEIGLG